MACACHEEATDVKRFTEYVDYITGTVLTFPRAKSAMDAIRTIGNEANHQRFLQIVTYMLNAIYSLPSA